MNIVQTLAQGGGGGGNNAFSVLKLVLVLVVLSFSAIGWILRKAAEKRAAREVQVRRARQQEEMLRTGRAEPERSSTPARQADAPPVSAQTTYTPSAGAPAHDEARRRLQEIAAKRRAELAEISRRAAQSGQATPNPPPSAASSKPGGRSAPPQVPREPARGPARGTAFPPPSTVQSSRPTSGGGVPIRPGESPERAIRRHRDEESRQNAALQRVARKKVEEQERSRQASERQRLQREREASRQEADLVPHLPHEAPPSQAATQAVSPLIRPVDAGALRSLAAPQRAAELRQAFIMSELLAPPVALRDESQA